MKLSKIDNLLQHSEAERDPCGDYRRLWESLEKAAAVRIEEVMAEATEMTEPFVAFEVARTLPAGDYHSKDSRLEFLSARHEPNNCPFGH